MDEAPTVNDTGGDFIQMDEALRLLWKWRKYRNQVFWSSMYRLGATSLLLTVAPYLLPNLIGRLGLAVLIFPILAALAAIFGSYLMIVQYMLYKLVDRKFRSLLGKFNPGDIAETLSNRPFRISIGKVLAALFLCFGLLGQIINALILVWLVSGGPL